MKSVALASFCMLVLLLLQSANAQQQTASSRSLLGGHGNNVAAFIAQYDATGDSKVEWLEFEAQRRQRYDNTDANADGIVDITEYVQEYQERSRQEIERNRVSQIEMTRIRFSALDADQSDGISRAEFDASGDKQYVGFTKMPAAEKTTADTHTTQRAARFDRRPGGPLGMPTSHTREGFLELYDDDGDGNVARAEYDRARAAQFARTDSDGNGQLSWDEYLDEYEDRLERRIALLGEDSDKQTRIRFGVLDADKDGRLTWSEYQASGKRTFDRADRSHDGAVDIADAKLSPPPRPARQSEPAARAAASGKAE